MASYAQYIASQRRQRLKEHVKFLMIFVKRYYCLDNDDDRNDYIKEFYLLPNIFKAVVIKYVRKMLDDVPLMELLSILTQQPHRVAVALSGLADAFRNEFNDLKVIEWATMVCAASTYLYYNGFTNAIPESILTINTICNHYSRYDAFTFLGCDV